MRDDKKTAFEASGEEQSVGLLGELFGLVKHNKKYWLIPLVLVLLIFGVLIILGSSVAAPFIYTIF